MKRLPERIENKPNAMITAINQHLESRNCYNCDYCKKLYDWCELKRDTVELLHNGHGCSDHKCSFDIPSREKWKEALEQAVIETNKVLGAMK